MIIVEYVPPLHVREFLRDRPHGLHADHRSHRNVRVWNSKGESLAGRVRWIDTKAAIACVFVIDSEGFRALDEETGAELEETLDAKGWTLQRAPHEPRERLPIK